MNSKNKIGALLMGMAALMAACAGESRAPRGGEGGSGGDVTAGSGGSGSGGGAAACKEIPATIVPGTTGEGEHIISAAVGSDGPVFLRQNNNTGVLTLVRPDGTKTTLEAAATSAGALAARGDGVVCAAWILQDSQEGFYACGPDFKPIDMGIMLDATHAIFLAESKKDCDASQGCMFAEDSASVFYDSAYVKTATRFGAAWENQELYESSISSFQDADTSYGVPLGCMITSERELGIVSPPDRVVTDTSIPPTGQAYNSAVSHCAMASHAGTLSVLYHGNNEVRLGTLRVKDLNLQTLSFQDVWSQEPVTLPITSSAYDIAAQEEGVTIIFSSGGEGLTRARRSGDDWSLSAVPGLETIKLANERPFIEAGPDGALHVFMDGAAASGELSVYYARLCPP